MPLIKCSRWARQWPLPACECTERDAIVKFRPLFSEFLRRKSILTRSEEHTSELQSLMRISYAVFCLKNKKYYRVDRMHTHRDHIFPTPRCALHRQNHRPINPPPPPQPRLIQYVT